MLLYIAIGFTLFISAICSLLEAFFLSIGTAEIEALKKKSQSKGLLLERYKREIETTTSAILSLNTVANTLGAVITGGLATQVFGEDSLLYFSIGMTAGILIFSEILPKNVGALYRVSMAPYLIYPLAFIRILMHPISLLCQKTVKTFLADTPQHKINSSREIQLLAEKGLKDGALSQSEYQLVANSLRLQAVNTGEVMTPRTVIEGIKKEMTLTQILEKYNNILPFARLPVYDTDTDHIIGLIRRRDVLKSIADGQDHLTAKDIMLVIPVIPETVNLAKTLNQLIHSHQQMAMIVDEFGNIAGVITLEDIFEYVLGQEIFEKDDVAIDMRELARYKQRAKKRKRSS